MDEEKEQKNGQVQTPASALNKGAKKLGEQAKKKVVKTIIATLVPILLKGIVIILAIYLAISAISHFLDVVDSEESKQASGLSIAYGDKAETNKITVNVSNITQNGAYKLSYKFEDESGNALTENQAIKQIKRDLLKENEKIDLSKFSDSELKIIGTLMYNGLDTGKYNEEQLKALAIFVKTDIAGKSFDLRSGDEKEEVTVEDLSKTDEVYGTLYLHKTTPTTDEEGNLTYKEIKLNYVSYETLKSMIEQLDSNALNVFSLDSEGNVIIAKSSSTSTKYTYQNENEEELSEIDKGKIDEEYIGEDEEIFTIKEYPLPINYKPYIIKYTANYGFLSDLLRTTNNVGFSMDIAELALNSKIVLNLREEQITTYIKDVTMYTQTTLLYDYVTYELSEYKVTGHWESIASGNGSPSNSSVPQKYGWSSSLGYTETGENGRTYIYSWTNGGQKYKLNFINLSTYQTWTLYKMVEEKTQDKKEEGAQALIVGGHITESYDGYTIDEDYTAKEEFNYTITAETTSIDYKYDIDISEIDCWYLTYKRPYTPPKVDETSYTPPRDTPGQYPQEVGIAQETTTDPSIINGDEHVTGFIKEKEQQYLKNNKNVDAAECKIIDLTIYKKSKVASKVVDYVGTRTKYTFGDEEDIDITQAHFKNLKYINGVPSFSSVGEDGKPEIGFLYIYDTYLNSGEDLCLQNDAEKEFFEILEADKETKDISEIMRFLLYIYDGIDRGVTDLDKNFAVIDLSFRKRSYGLSAFGCNLTREEFIAATKEYQGDSILATLAEEFYDICTSPEYNVNPCLAYAWAATESGWGSSAVEDKNLFQIGTYTDQTSGNKYNSFEDSIKAFCQWTVDAADPSTSLYSFNYTRAQEYATENSKFSGTPDSNIYAQFCTFGFVGYVHTGNARACIKKSSEYLYGVNECNHSDSDETTTKERADWANFVVDTKADLAKEIFGKDCFLGHGSIVEAAYEVADHFMNSGVTVHYAAAHKGGNNIILPDQHNIEACYDYPIENPEKYGIVCTTFVNLAIWKAGLIDTEIINTFNIHSPIGSAMSMQGLEGWEEINSVDELQEGDVVWSEGHTWIYMEGDKMLDQTYCVINSNGTDTRGYLKNANLAFFKKGFRYVGS